MAELTVPEMRRLLLIFLPGRPTPDDYWLLWSEYRRIRRQIARRSHYRMQALRLSLGRPTASMKEVRQ